MLAVDGSLRIYQRQKLRRRLEVLIDRSFATKATVDPGREATFAFWPVGRQFGSYPETGFWETSRHFNPKR